MKNLLILILALLSANFLFSQVQWTKYSNNPVHGWGGQPTVIFENDTFKMWFAYGTADSLGTKIVTGYATSTNGIDWTDYPGNPVLDVGVPGTWDDRVHDTPCVLRDSSGYKMWFTGADHIGFPWIDSLTLVFGYAYSDDGINWTKHPDPVLTKGGPGSWERLWLETPSVIYDEGLYKMWYSGESTETGLSLSQVGYATSPDGVSWTKHPTNPVLPVGLPGEADDKVAGVGSVLKVDSLYMMWYCAVSQLDTNFTNVEVHFASSQDGISWTKYYNNPLLTPTYPTVDADTISPWAPSVVYTNNEFYIWYEGICYATAPYTFTAISQCTSAGKTNVFPNPTKGNIYIGSDHFLKAELYDLQGGKLESFKTNRINLSQYKNGIYILKISTQDKIISEMIIKQ